MEGSNRKMYSYFELAGNKPTFAQIRYIDHLFSNANDLVTLFQEINRHKGTRFIFPLSRLMVSELNIWRYGIFKIGSGKLTPLIRNSDASSQKLLTTFDDYFGRVREHRNVLQHFGEYTYGDQQPASVNRRELERINANIRVAPGASIAGFYSNYVGERFCSSDRSGEIQDVYIGQHFTLRVVGVLSLLCTTLSSEGTEFNLVMGLNVDQHDKIRQDLLDSFDDHQ